MSHSDPRADARPAKLLQAGVWTGMLLWAFTAVAPRHDVQAHGPAAPVPSVEQRAEVHREAAESRAALRAAEVERRHKLALGRRMWTARWEERARRERLARLRQQEEARRREAARQREQARRQAVRKAEAAARAAAPKAEARRASARTASAGRRTAADRVAVRLDELQLLARIVQIEAGGEPYEGKVAVAAVILNRVRSPRFPDSVRAVIYQPGQFPTAAERIPQIRPSSAALRAARDALAGRDPSNGALYFYNPARQRCGEGGGGFLCALEVTARIGNHVFAR
ncbi:cell wall hydrolase [Thermaerobacter sp. FW80]|nr:cell wall hydrolase [Thermaerobacter sp. FW80]